MKGSDTMQLVSCIMPTSIARQQFIPLALAYFLRQDYGSAELIIVDDGTPSLEHLIPALPGIKYIRVPQRFDTIGAKRNYACALAKGSIILHWDDDDWYAPNWISRQVSMLESSQAGITGLSNLCFFNPASERCWLYTYNYNKQPWVAGATMAYLKTVWEQQPFPDVRVGEDNAFVWGTDAKVVAHDYTDGFVSILHSRNTSPKLTSNQQWKKINLIEVQRILGKDMEAYVLWRLQ